MRVLLCCSDIDSYRGGMVTVTRNLLGWKKFQETEYIFIATHAEGSRLAKCRYFARACLKILFMLGKGQIDAAHLLVSERGSFYRKALLFRLCRHFGVPVAFHHHGAEFNDFYDALPPGRKRHVRKVLEGVDVNLVLSEYWQKSLKLKAPEAKTRILYNAVEVPDRNEYGAGRNALVILGRLGRRKGTFDFLLALKKIDPLLPEGIRCYLCGDGEIGQVREKVEELGLWHRIAHIGWIDGEQKEKLFRITALHILPSYLEGLPMSILETMAHGIPNISTRIAAIPEVISDGENGVLLLPGDVDALSERLLLLMGDERLRLQYSRNAYRKLRDHFSLDVQAKELEKIYRELKAGGISGEAK